MSAKKAEPLCWRAERLTEQAKTEVLASDYNTTEVVDESAQVSRIFEEKE